MDQARRTYLQRHLKGWEASLSLWLADLLVTVQKVCGAGRKGKLHGWLDAWAPHRRAEALVRGDVAR